MPRQSLLTPLLALLFACSGGGDTTTTGFESGPATTGGPGPSSFGDSSSGSAATTGELPTTGEPLTATTTPDPTTTTAPVTSSTDADTTTSEPGTSTTADTSPDTTADSGTTDATGTCGDGILDPDEFCDDGNQIDTDACRSDCHPGTALLALVGQGSDPGVVLTFDPELGWSDHPAPMALLSAELEATPTGALAVLRRSSAIKLEHETLHAGAWSPGDATPLADFTAIGTASTADRPSLAAVADTVTLGFLGLDNKHFSALHTENGWAAPVKIPAGQLDIQAFGPSGPTVVPGAVETYAVYTGDDARIYYSMKSSPGGTWSASTATPPASVLGRPVAVVDAAADLVLAYVRKSDGKLAVIKLLTPQNAWTKEVVIHPQAITGGDISLARQGDGRYALAWRGFDTQGIYLSLTDDPDDIDTWTAPQTVEVPPSTSTPPLLVPGTTGADLEILYTAGGKLRHARLVDADLKNPTDVPGPTKAASIAATRVQLTP